MTIRSRVRARGKRARLRRLGAKFRKRDVKKLRRF